MSKEYIKSTSNLIVTHGPEVSVRERPTFAIGERVQTPRGRGDVVYLDVRGEWVTVRLDGYRESFWCKDVERVPMGIMHVRDRVREWLQQA